MKKTLSNRKGFTLMELVVVIAIIAILAGIIVAAIMMARRQATNTGRQGNVRTVEAALESYANANNGNYPNVNSWQSLVAAGGLLRGGGAAPIVTGNYLTQDVGEPTDNMNYDYMYKSNSTTNNKGYTLVSCKVEANRTTTPNLAYNINGVPDNACGGTAVNIAARANR